MDADKELKPRCLGVV